MTPSHAVERTVVPTATRVAAERLVKEEESVGSALDLLGLRPCSDLSVRGGSCKAMILALVAPRKLSLEMCL